VRRAIDATQRKRKEEKSYRITRNEERKANGMKSTRPKKASLSTGLFWLNHLAV